MLTNRLYDVTKFFAQIVLPALGTLYFGLAQLWDLPKPEEVVGTITLVDAFLGILLGLSSSTYHKSDAKYDGAIEVTETEDKKNFALSLDTHPDDLDQKQEVLFKVTKGSPLVSRVDGTE